MKHFLPSHAAGGVCFQGNIEYYSAEVELKRQVPHVRQELLGGVRRSQHRQGTAQT